MSMKTKRTGSRLFIVCGLTLRNARLDDIPIHLMRVSMEHRLQRQQLHALPSANTNRRQRRYSCGGYRSIACIFFNY